MCVCARRRKGYFAFDCIFLVRLLKHSSISKDFQPESKDEYEHTRKTKRKRVFKVFDDLSVIKRTRQFATNQEREKKHSSLVRSLAKRSKKKITNRNGKIGSLQRIGACVAVCNRVHAEDDDTIVVCTKSDKNILK